MDRKEKRRHKRLGAKYSLSCRQVGATDDKSFSGHTVNVSTGGVYFETETEIFKQGSLLRIELDVPPTSGLLEFGGKIAGYAKVLRTQMVSGKHGVAVQFCRPPKLSV